MRWAAEGFGSTCRYLGSSRRPTCRCSDRQHRHESAPLGWRRRRGALVQAIGVGGGGRNSKLHALADCRAADTLRNDLALGTIVLADEAYDSNAIRDSDRAARGAVPNIPSKANRRWKSCFSKTLYKGRNAIEPMFCRLKDDRLIAARYDKPAINFLGAICVRRCRMVVMSPDLDELDRRWRRLRLPAGSSPPSPSDPGERECSRATAWHNFVYRPARAVLLATAPSG